MPRSLSHLGPVKSTSALVGSKLVPANGERKWLAGDGRIRGGTDARDGRRRRGSTRNDGEAVGDRPLAVLRTVTLNVPTVPILTVVRCSLYSSSAVRARSAKPLISRPIRNSSGTPLAGC